jgi:hypothetical protein
VRTGTLALGLATESLPPAPTSTPLQPHPSLARLAQLYAAPAEEDGSLPMNGSPLMGLGSNSRSGKASQDGLQDVVTQQWQRLRGMRLQGVHA